MQTHKCKYFELELSSDHPFISGHIINGQRVLPGLAYIDVVYQMASHLEGFSHTEYSLDSMTIFNPLVVENGKSLTLRFNFSEKGLGWSLVVSGGADSNQQDNELTRYLSVELNPCSITFSESVNPEDYKKSASQNVELEKIYADNRKKGLFHSGIIKAHGNAYGNDDSSLIELIANDAEDATYLLHPAILDGAVVCSSILDTQRKELLLPIFVESFFSTTTLNGQCYAQVYKSSIERINEITRFDVLFFDKRGRQTSVLKGFTSKKLRTDSLLSAVQKADAKYVKVEEFSLVNVDVDVEKTADKPTEIIASLQTLFSHYSKQSLSGKNTETNFFELGIDSSQLLNIVSDIEKRFSLSLSPTLLFEYPNLKELAVYLSSMVRDIAAISPKNTVESTLDSAAIATSRNKQYQFFKSEPFLQDHLILKKAALMGVTYPSLVLETLHKNCELDFPIHLSNGHFLGGPVFLDKYSTVDVDVQVTRSGRNADISVYSLTSSKQEKQRRFKVTCTDTEAADKSIHEIDLKDLISQARKLDNKTIADSFQFIESFTLGSSLKNIEAAYVCSKEIQLLKLNLEGKETKGTLSEFLFDPLILAACFALPLDNTGEYGSRLPYGKAYIPLYLGSLTLYRPASSRVYILRTNRSVKPGYFASDIKVLSENGELIAEIRNASVKEVSDIHELIVDDSQDDSNTEADIYRNLPKTQNIDRDIAIIGVAGRYPAAEDLYEFWQNLISGKDCITEIPEERWDWQDYYSDDRSKSGYAHSKWGGFIKGHDEFDPLFFKISPREATMMDPQERLFLQTAWHAMEDAGYTREGLENTEVGVFVGVMQSEYLLYSSSHASPESRLGIGGGTSSVATRISYICDFNGPSMAIDTMCSSSMTALYLACQSIRDNRINSAIVGGINLNIHPNKYLLLSQGQFISSRGWCESFGNKGDGYVPSEGVGALFIKKLADAVNDNDNIYGVIKGIAINHGGKAIGYTAPNPKAQAKLISLALKDANCDCSDISYVEAHGTGTPLGDPIEISALTDAYGKNLHGNQYCKIGSVKSNIGHLEAAAGIAGITKLLLQIKYNQLVPSIHSETLNPNIAFEKTPFVVQRELSQWYDSQESKGLPLQAPLKLAAVSGFGAGGSNAHVIIQEFKKAPSDLNESYHSGPFVILLSAKSEVQLQTQAKNLVNFLVRGELKSQDLPSIAFTLQVGREAMDERLSLVVTSIDELRVNLNSWLKDGTLAANMFNNSGQKNEAMLALFSDDEELQEAMHKWVSRGKLEKLAKLWTQGLNFQWQTLYPGKKPARISLPTYPFAKNRYWIKTENSGLHQPGLANNDLVASVQQQATLLTPVWESVPEESDCGFKINQQKVLLVTTSDFLANDFQQSWPSATFLMVRSDVSADDIKDTFAQHSDIEHIVWCVEGQNKGINLLTAAQHKRPILTLFGFVNVLLNEGLENQQLNWTVLTFGAKAVYPNESRQPGQASIHGFMGSVAKEVNNWNIRVIDVANNETLDFNALVNCPVTKNLTSLAYRNQQWMQQILVPVPHNVADGAPYKVGGVYIVIGGAGGLGRVFSQWLLEHYKANIIWIGRSDYNQQIKDKISSFGRYGNNVTYLQGYASKADSLLRAYREIKHTHNKINGLVISTLDSFDRPVKEMDSETFEKVLSAKIDVGLQVASVFGNEQMDFVSFFSSVASFEHGGGFSGYSSGCEFLDAFSALPDVGFVSPVKIVNWGYWHVGSGERVSDAMKKRLSNVGIGAIEAPEGMKSLEELIASPLNQMAVIKLSHPQGFKGIDWGQQVKNLQQDFSAMTVPGFKLPEKFSKVRADWETGPESIDAICLALLWSFMHSIRVLEKQSFTLSEIKAKAVIDDFYIPWLEEVFSIFVEHQYLFLEEDTYKIFARNDNTEDQLWERWKQRKPFWAQDHSNIAQVELLEDCLKHLPAILTGKLSATEIMFPAGSMAKVEGIYKGNEFADSFNDILGKTLIGCLESRLEEEPDCKIRILEIGAGTGGTSAGVLAKLAPYKQHVAEYCYTDISKSFLFHAQNQYAGDYPFLTTKLLNVENPIEEQGIESGKFDFVIATNVLHATRNIRETLRNTKATMKKNAVLLLNEIVENTLFSHLTFGLLEGWWRAEDRSIRIKGSPCLSVDGWTKVMNEEGYDKVDLPIDSDFKLVQQILVATSNGVIRQPVSSVTPEPRPNEKPVTATLVVPDLPVEAPSDWQQPAKTPVTPDRIQEGAIAYFKKIIATTLHMSSGLIDSFEPFDSYGIDSILANEINSKLVADFGDISRTLLFDYQTVEALTEYFIENHEVALLTVLNSRKKPEAEVTSNTNNALSSTKVSRGIPALTAQTESPIEEQHEANQLGLSSVSKSPYLNEQGAIENNTTARNNSERPHNSVGQNDNIAIIGFSGRFPGGDLSQWWEGLKKGECFISEIPPERWSLDDFYFPDTDEAITRLGSYSKWGSFLQGVADFDPLFFNIAPNEAATIDPQERLFLEECWKALEDAGYASDMLPDNVRKTTGVFGGITKHGFNLHSSTSGQVCTTSFSSCVNRVSHTLNLQGPSLPVDTMCSSALVAIHEACDYLRSGNGLMALAGAVNLYLHPSTYRVLSANRLIASTDKPQVFGAQGDGFVPGEGVGVVVLKCLSQAEADGDFIHAVICGSAFNHSGRTNGYMTPSAGPQQQVIADALAQNQLDPRTISYIEAAANGAEMSDAVEMAALTRVFGQRAGTRGSYSLGSLKGHVGHSEAASGMAQLFKVLFSLRDGVLAPMRLPVSPNPNISFDRLPFELQSQLSDWQAPEVDGKIVPRRAGISSHGAGGINAHLIIEEYPLQREPMRSEEVVTFVLSARTTERLEANVRQWHHWLSVQDTVPLRDVAAMLQLGRNAMPVRLSLRATNREALVQALAHWLNQVSQGAPCGDVVETPRGVVHWNNTREHRIEDAAAVKMAENNADSEMLGALWVAGNRVNWLSLYPSGRPRKVPGLPLYLFCRKHCWPADNKIFKNPTLNMTSGKSEIVNTETIQRHTKQAQFKKTERTLRGIFSEVHGLNEEELREVSTFGELGLTSMNAVHIINAINQTFNQRFHSSTVFEFNTFSSLAAYINKRLPVADSESSDNQSDTSHKKVVHSVTGSQINEAIAVTGMASRCAGANNLEEFWDVIANGRDCIQSVSDPNWLNFFERYHSNMLPVRYGAMSGIEYFDPMFFRISPMEADAMDVAQRILLEEIYHAFEDACCDPGALRGQAVGVFIGNIGMDTTPTREDFSLSRLLGSDTSILAARISYHLDLKGPALTVNTACSSSMMAMDIACQKLKTREVDMSVAGGITIYTHPAIFVSMYNGRMLSPTAQCKPFDNSANGILVGDGAGIVLLKRLSDAERDGDRIYGVIRGGGSNQDGQTSGLTVPSFLSQSKLQADVYRRHNIAVEDIQYVEAHGTATKLGDPIEIHALSESFGEFTDKKRFCAIGSVKANIGHTTAASGVMGLIKVLLCLSHKQLPPSINFDTENEHIDFANSPVYVNTELKAWPLNSKGSRLSVINSFGISGTNTHFVVEGYDAAPAEACRETDQPSVFVLSAQSQERLQAHARQMRDYLARHDEMSLHSVVHSLQIGREAMAHRLALVITSRKDLLEALSRWTENGTLLRGATGEVREAPAEECKISQTIEARDYDRIAALWVKGAHIDWQALYAEAKPTKISLPGYPFEREVYRVADLDIFQVNSQDGTSDYLANAPYKQESNAASELMSFEEVWVEQSLRGSNRPFRSDTLVCFLAAPHKQQIMREQVQKSSPNTQLVFISPAQQQKKLADDQYLVLPDETDSWQQCLQQIREDFGDIGAIAYLWPLDSQNYITEYQYIMRLIQSLVRAGVIPRRILLGGQCLPDGQSGLQIAEHQCYLESWIGFERSLKQVLPASQLACIIQAYEDGQATDARQVLAHISQELFYSEHFCSVLYRGTQRYQSRVQETRLPPMSDEKPLFQANDTWLITGGLGGLGWLFAKHLAGYGVNLILSGRSALTPSKQQQLNTLTSSGVKVHYIRGDVTDRETMSAGLSVACSKVGAINGVLHAAGVPGSVSIFEQTVAGFHEVLDAKVAGTLLLDELLAEQPLKHVHYFSSAAAIVGDNGSCDYAAANRFQMAYAAHRNRNSKRRGRASVINWTYWLDGGIKYASDELLEGFSTGGQQPITAKQGLTFFEQVHHAGLTQQMILFGHRQKTYAEFLLVTHGHSSRAEKDIVTSKLPRAPQLNTHANISVDEFLEKDIKNIINSVLRVPVEKIGDNLGFEQFGFDSISFLSFAKKLSEHFDINITPALFYSYTSTQKLHEHLLSEYRLEINHKYAAGKDTSKNTTADNNAPLINAHSPVKISTKTPKSTAINQTEPLESSENANEVAIIGMSGRFPNARSVDELWQTLYQSENAVTELSREWLTRANAPVSKTRRWLGAIPGIDEFDPLFFEISPHEAETMDPRQRILLQESWNALEDAGVGNYQIKNQNIAMFVGVEHGDYHLLDNEKGNITANKNAILAARLAYFLNLSGPVMAIDTACSSGLVAAHQACMSLKSGETDSAIVAAAHAMFSLDSYVELENAGMLSPQGKCFAFDQRANGIVPAEAIAVVVLKLLSKAIEDGDHIYAVIEGSGVNYDGKTNGITVPGGASQTSLISSVYQRYGINPKDIQYVVTHGTGTKLGDPIEVSALCEVFDAYGVKGKSCALGSTKTNFGHTMAASGLLSLISLALSLKHKTIPASLHCLNENEFLNLEQSPFYVNKERKMWKVENQMTRRGAVSAFGMSGTNSHMIVREYKTAKMVENNTLPNYVLVLSAKTEIALKTQVKNLLQFIEQGEGELANICFTLQTGRHHFECRLAMVVENLEDTKTALLNVLNQEQESRSFKGKVSINFKPKPEVLQRAKQLVSQEQYSVNLENMTYLAEHFCQGYEIEWQSLYTKPWPVKLKLPTYPFVRQKYWSKARKKQAHDTNIYVPEIKVMDRSSLEYLLDSLVDEEVSETDAEASINAFFTTTQP